MSNIDHTDTKIVIKGNMENENSVLAVKNLFNVVCSANADLMCLNRQYETNPRFKALELQVGSLILEAKTLLFHTESSHDITSLLKTAIGLQEEFGRINRVTIGNKAFKDFTYDRNMCCNLNDAIQQVLPYRREF